jgi:hypothetical protein
MYDLYACALHICVMVFIVPWGASALDLPPIRGANDRRPILLPPTMTAPSVASTPPTSGAPSAEVKAAPTGPVAVPPNSDGVSHLSKTPTPQLSTDSKHKSYETLIKINNKKVDEV